MRQALGPMRFDDEHRAQSAKRKARLKNTEDGQPVHSFRTLLDDLAIQLQRRALDLLGVTLAP